MATVRSNRVAVDGEIRPARVTVDGGIITDVDSATDADQDFGDLVIMPGLVDSHVHVNEPGRTEWEGFATATRAAAAGGATTIVDMPLNSIPPTTSVPGLQAKRRAADGQLAVDVAFWGGMVPGNEQELGPLATSGVCGFKCFLVDSGVPEFPAVDHTQLEAGLATLAGVDLPLLVHAEDGSLLSQPEGPPTDYRTYLATRPAESEAAAVAGVVVLAREVGAKLHILHVSSADAVEEMAMAGGVVSAETCPHYLTFAASDIPKGATQFKCAPPIRQTEHREALWDGLRTGKLTMVVSDHSPAPIDLKKVDTGDFIEAWGGISSLQLRLSATWTGAAARGFELVELVEWLASAPARMAGLDDRKGTIEPGFDADLVIWDPDAATVVRGPHLLHRHPLTPYHGVRLKGRVTKTILRGIDVYSDGIVHGAHGRMLVRR